MNARQAFLLAVDAHANADDKGGVPYIFHPIAVAEAVRGLGEDYEVVALLHDVFEDTDRTIEELVLGTDPEEYPSDFLTPAQTAALRAITKTETGENSYWDYIRRVRENFIARVVKIADVKHNLSPERQAGLDPKMVTSLAKRYRKTLAILEA